MTAKAAQKASSNGGRVADGAPQIVSLQSSDGPEPERVELFQIDGKPYYVTARPKINMALRYMHIARVQGTDMAIDYMLGQLLGEESYEALMGFDDLTMEQFQQIITIASTIMAGAIEPPKDGPRKG
jgi:hypothetical protein